jgi:hypothetical protein
MVENMPMLKALVFERYLISRYISSLYDKTSITNNAGAAENTPKPPTLRDKSPPSWLMT